MIRCIGRNGNFAMEKWRISPVMNGYSTIDIYSSKIGRNPPIQFKGTPQDLLDLFGDIIVEIDRVIDNDFIQSDRDSRGRGKQA